MVATGLDRKKLLWILLSTLIVTAGVLLALQVERAVSLSATEAKIKQKLAGESWTAQRISDELQTDDKALVRDALFRAVDRGSIGDQRTECTTHTGAVLSTRIYFNEPAGPSQSSRPRPD